MIPVRNFVAGLAAALTFAAACLPGGGSGPVARDRADAGGLDLGDGGAGTRRDVDVGDPFAVDGLFPSHGPFTGGTRAQASGRGFGTRMRVFVGGTELPPEAVLASSPTRLALQVPPGKPGPAEVRIVNVATAQERRLPDGFVYDAFVVRPDTGATSGGTRVELEGSGTAWGSAAGGPGTEVTIGGRACTEVTVKDMTHLSCLTPAQPSGAKDVVVTSGVDRIQVRDAFTYDDAVDGYRGGLSGGALSSRLRVLAFDSYTGKPLVGATVIAGDDLVTGKVAKITASGVVEINDVSSSGKVTVTVTAKCHQPISFVDVPVDTVTVYLDPVLDLSCIEGDPPSLGGGGGRYGGLIEGQLVFPGGVEFRRAGWSGVPAPSRPTERQAAYVFFAANSPSERFRLPSAIAAITPDSVGDVGYGYEIVGAPGNHTLYAVAGLEDRSEIPPRFLPYVMGVVRGVGLPAKQRVTGVDIPMTVLLDHELVLAPSPGAPGPRGPDRLVSEVALSLGPRFAALPLGVKITPLPITGQVSFVGLPSLDNVIATEAYVISSRAVTGAREQVPMSVVSRLKTNTTSGPIAIGGFLPVPLVAEPGSGPWSGTRVRLTTGSSGSTIDMVKLVVASRNDLISWTIVAPGTAREFPLPDLSALPGPDPLGLSRGNVQTTVYTARIDGFSYGKLRYGQLSPGSWAAYSMDSLPGVY